MNKDILNTTEPVEEEHGSLFCLFIDFWTEVFNFFKFIFYDLLLGETV